MLRFPPGVVCYFCLALYVPGAQQPPASLCDYPDVLKELVYTLHQDASWREKIFKQLGRSPPQTLSLYKRHTKLDEDGVLGAYSIISAYLDIREEEGRESNRTG